MIQKHPLLKSTAILTCAGMVSRIIGFFYRIFLSKTIGAEGIGIYLLLFPIQTLQGLHRTTKKEPETSFFAA